MRLITFLCGLIFLIFALPAWGQGADPVYTVANVAVDVSAASASAARDQAMLEAQNTAFLRLLDRLGSKMPSDPPDDKVIAALVSSLEVQKEHIAGPRYTGVFTVAFKSERVRQYLSGQGVSYFEMRAKPVVVLPVFKIGERAILWEQTTPWAQAWSAMPRQAGLAPVIIPQGDLDDIALISAQEALKGSEDVLQNIMKHHKAEGVIVPVLEADLDQTGALEALVTVYRYDNRGRPLSPFRIALETIKSKNMIEAVLHNATQQVMAQIESSWREDHPSLTQPPSYLPVRVLVPTLAVWTALRKKLDLVQDLIDVNVVTMTRGLVHIELVFRGDLQDLQAALAVQGLALVHGYGRGWELSYDAAE
ncbi:MAG: DUF2066 domain-containing protein [Alphaproteobacteria bacterium]|nr:DUF2066 domain-containing protein [Alphaproteobacteria bacterium]